jgi:hypothetical protein
MKEISSQETLDHVVKTAKGPGDPTVRRQLSIMCDKQPERVGLFLGDED